jgi:ketosteroid isomerase-like protein
VPLHRFLIATLALAAAAFAQDPASLDRLWREAVLKKDFAALERMLDDGLVYAHSTGIVDTKSAYLEKLRSGRQVYQTMEQKNVSHRNYGRTAVTHSWMHVTGINQAGPFDDKVMMLHVWIRQNGRWLLAAHQTTKVDKMP